MPLIDNEPLLYRFGFVCIAASELPSGDLWKALRSEWQSTQMRDLLVLVHPEMPVTPISDSALLIGHAFAVGVDQSPQDLLETAIAAGSDLALHETLDVLSGRFALITSQGGGRVYHDAFGSRSVFYRLGQSPCIASHSGLIAELFGITIDPLVDAISCEPEFARRQVKDLPGDLSVHDGVRALVPNNYYDILAGRTVRYWPRVPRKKTTIDRFHSCADAYFGSFAEYLCGYLTPVLGITAGIDSRAIVAAFRHYKLPMKYVTWKGYALPEQELPVVERMASYLGGQHTLLPEKGQEDGEPFHRIRDLAGKNFGRLHGRSNIHSKIAAYMYQTFKGQRDLVFIRGYGGEIVRGFAPYVKRPIETTSVADLVRGYTFISPSEKYGKLVSEAVEQFVLHANYEGLDKFGYDLNDLYYWEHRMGIWGSSNHNEIDTAMLSMSGFNSRHLFESAFGLIQSERLVDGLLLDLTRRYDEGLAIIPVNPEDKKPKPGKGVRNVDASLSDNQLYKQLKASHERNKALKERLEKQESELKELRGKYRETVRERNRLKRWHLQMEQSRTWRYTLPIRRIVGVLKRILRR